jgi:hypothetical protein
VRRAAALAIAMLFAIGASACRTRKDYIGRDDEKRHSKSDKDKPKHDDETPRTPQVLAEGLDYPDKLVVDAHFVYVLASDRIYRVPLEGGMADEVAPALGEKNGLAIDADAIYTVAIAAAPVRVWAVPLDGKAPHALAEIEDGFRLTIDDTNVYVVSGAGEDSILYSVPKSGGVATVLVDHLAFAADVSVSGDDVVFVEYDKNRIGRVKKTGGTPRWIATAPTTVLSMTANDDAIVWSDTQIHALLGGASEPSVVSSGATGDAHDVSLRDGFVYWGDRDENGWVYRASVGGGATQKIAASAHRIEGIATDARYVYWVERGTMSDGGMLLAKSGRLLRAER